MSEGIARHVILIDDDAFLVSLYAEKFKLRGFEPRVFLKAREALEALATGTAPAVIIVDIVMPDMDGFGFLEARRAGNLAPGAKVVVLTNETTEAEEVHARELGADTYIVKATKTPSEVVDAVEALLT
jgi:DNA-binding response OmpR family regulator